jgi:glycine oxidase
VGSRSCCVVGGGIIGLSIARELAGRGHQVRVLTREPRRATASWAAVGIFPPAPPPGPDEPNAALTALSTRLHRQWSQELREETGVDNGLLPCGGLYVASNELQLELLRASADGWLARGARCQWLSASDLAEVEPALGDAVAAGRLVGGFLLPDELQFRSPRHLEALERSCRSRGVVIDEGVTVDRIDTKGTRVTGLTVSPPRGLERVTADCYVVAAGAWTGGLATDLGLTLDTRPIRGQIALVRMPGHRLGRIVNRGLHYLVPREDDLILAGSTIEDVGFDPITVPEAIDGLLGVAFELLGDVSGATLERSWAGLRPGSADGLPSIGRAGNFENAFVAAGHFRAGLHQSPGTAVTIADLVEGQEPAVDLAAFTPGRTIRDPGPDAVPTMLARAAAETAETQAARGERRR